MSMLKTLVKRVPGATTAYRLALRAGSATRYVQEYREFKSIAQTSRTDFVPEWSERFACLDNRTTYTPFDRHYVYHTAWATRKLKDFQPRLHVDISSSLYFAALASAIVPMRHLDYRPPNLVLSGLECGQGDLSALPFRTGEVESLSCMHVIEHIGLGRYGDPIDPSGDLKACRELQRVLAAKGRLLFVVPVGRQRVCFNAHRVYQFETACNLFDELQLIDHALIPDDANQGIVESPPASMINQQEYGCGCFLFEKAPQSEVIK